jgi:AcrR family transcriptional regulator
MPAGERDMLRRERLLAAGLQLFGTVGYRGTTVQGLCQEAGVSSRSFYELFEGREALLEAVYVRATREIVAGLAAIRMPDDGGSGSGSGAVDEVVRAGVRAAIGPMLADERLGRVVEIEAVGVSESLERRRRVTNLGIARAADRLQEAMMAGGLIPRRPTGLSSIVMVGGVTEAMVAQITSPGRQRLPAEDFLEEMARVIGRLLR